MKMTYKEYNQRFDAIRAAILDNKPLPQNNCKQWQDYAIIVQDVCTELKIPHTFVGSVNAAYLHGQPVFMADDIRKYPLEVRDIIKDFQDVVKNNYKAEFVMIIADQCYYLIIAY